MTAGTPRAPHGVSATGVQRAIGERRRRRERERGGQLDLDATMSSWPEPDPPARARPVVRPRRALPGSAAAPGLPTPHAILVREHAEPVAPSPSGSTPVRRARRSGAVAAGVAGAAASAGAAAAGAAGGAAAGVAAVAGSGARRTATAVAAAGATLARPATGLLAGGGIRERSAPSDPTLRVVTRTSARRAAEPAAPESPAERSGRIGPPSSPARADDPFRGFGARSHTAGPAPAGAATLSAARSAAPPARRPLDAFPGGSRGARGPTGSTRSRAASALDEPRRRRLPVSAPILGGAAAAVVVLLAVLVVVVRQGGAAPPSAALVPAEAPRQETVLVNLLDDDGAILRGLLMAVGPGAGGEDGVVPVIVPGEMTVAVPDAGSLPLAQAPTVGPDAPDRAVEDLLGVRVDGTWVVDRALLADHVDTAGGVEVDVAAAVTAGQVTIPVGPGQRLTGAQAAVYATAAVEGEEPGVSLARFAQVVLGLVAAMPTEAGEVTRLLSQVDRHPDTTATSEQLTRVLADASGMLADQDEPVPLTVPTADGGEGPPTADPEGVALLVDERLPGARLPVSTVGPLQVVVGNAVGEPGLVTAARDRLVAAGFRFAGGGTVEGEPAPATTVLVPSDTPENRERGLAVAAALGIPPEALFVKADFDADVPEGTDIIVWLGQDYADALEGQE
jgi:hypothetical protein